MFILSEMIYASGACSQSTKMSRLEQGLVGISRISCQCIKQCTTQIPEKRNDSNRIVESCVAGLSLSITVMKQEQNR